MPRNVGAFIAIRGRETVPVPEFLLWAAVLLGLAGGTTAPGGDLPASGSRSDGPGIAAEPIPLAPTVLDSIAIGLPPVLTLQSRVKDPVFALLISLVAQGHYGTLTQERLERELGRHGARSRLPYKSVVELTRLPVRVGATARVEVRFREKLDLPIPYSILGYHPGSFRVSQECDFREWILGTVRLPLHHDDDTLTQLTLEDVHLFAVERGEVEIDVDGWLDAVMGGSLDDTDVTALMLCRHDGEWLGFAMGYNREHRGRSGAFRFRQDEIAFPTPDELKTVGRTMRGRAEALSARWTERVSQSPSPPSPGPTGADPRNEPAGEDESEARGPEDTDPHPEPP